MTVLAVLGPSLEVTLVQQNLVNCFDAFDNVNITSREHHGACRPDIYLTYPLYTQLLLCSLPHSSMAFNVFFVLKNVPVWYGCATMDVFHCIPAMKEVCSIELHEPKR